MCRGCFVYFVFVSFCLFVDTLDIKQKIKIRQQGTACARARSSRAACFCFAVLSLQEDNEVAGKEGRARRRARGRAGCSLSWC